MSTPKSTVRAIGNEIANLPQVKELLKKYGINADSFTVKINEVEGNSFGPSKFAQHGLPENIIGKTVRLANREFTIVDVKPQNSQGSLKKCVVIEGAAGGRYVTTAADINRALRALGNVSRPLVSDVFGDKIPLSNELSKQFESLSARLSPENLSCDGEISKGEISRRYNEIMKEWRGLEKLAGRTVSQNEFPY